MTGEAHLYHLKDNKHLGAITYTAYNNPIGPGMLDFGITSEDPENNIRYLKDRLYGYIHEFAQANLAKQSQGVDSIHELVEGGPWIPDTLKNKVIEAENKDENEE